MWNKQRSKDNAEKEECVLAPIQRPQMEVTNVVGRRLFFQTYTTSLFTGTIFFLPNNLAQYDYPSEDNIVLQYNAILASATRIHGAPTSLCTIFEHQARIITKKLLTDFSYNTALGFHLLSIHYWGLDVELSRHYRDLTISVCARALRRPQSLQNIRNLIILRALSLGILDSEDLNDPLSILQNIEQDIQCQNPDITLAQLNLCEPLGFFQFLTAIAKILRYNKDGELIFLTQKPLKMDSIISVIQGIRDKLLGTLTNPCVIALTKLLYYLLMGIALFHTEPSEAALFMQEAIRITHEDEFRIALAGPRFIAIFDAAFKVSYKAKSYEIASAFLNIQKKQMELFPAATEIVQKNIATMVWTDCGDIHSEVIPFQPVQMLKRTTSPFEDTVIPPLPLLESWNRTWEFQPVNIT